MITVYRLTSLTNNKFSVKVRNNGIESVIDFKYTGQTATTEILSDQIKFFKSIGNLAVVQIRKTQPISVPKSSLLDIQATTTARRRRRKR